MILLDLGLPDSDGLDTLRAMRRRAADTPVVVLTGNDDERLGLAAIQEGAQDYVVKGQIPGTLLSRVLRYALERHLYISERKRNEMELDRHRHLGRPERSLDRVGRQRRHDPLRAKGRNRQLARGGEEIG